MFIGGRSGVLALKAIEVSLDSCLVEAGVEYFDSRLSRSVQIHV
jgi:hypothetical protein